MIKVAYIFPGQGAQYVGMGQDFYQCYPQAKEIFEQAADVLGFNLGELIFEGPTERLTRTDNCQVAILTVSVAALAALKAENLPIAVKYTAGLSLGEYTALVAAETLEFAEAIKLVRMRGQYMDQACQRNPGGMVSLMGLPLDAVEKICTESKAEVANLNCPGQIVISGSLSALEKARQLAEACGAKKIIPLQVAGAFHSSLMAYATEKLTQALAQTQIFSPKIPVVSNVTARKQELSEEIKDNLARQLVMRTLWEDSVRSMVSSGINNFLEIGPGKVLKGLLRRINPQLKVYNIGTVEELEKFKQECGYVIKG